jgi:hypothetical protein
LSHAFFVSAPIDRFDGSAKIETHTLSLGLSYKF